MFNNQISSVFNDTDQPWAFYKGADYTGDSFILQPGQFISDLGGTDFNDTITSYRSEPLAS